ncbi:MAG TPA: adenosylcobinamide-GDP ribazoletransferase [Polyangiaceae bacterium]|jgi:adenosylcobinamide-GDP ribazoletransferase|nr:adenosylcobinamide-GDP ribazoletransferase [Polyangiaceae bacterium]
MTAPPEDDWHPPPPVRAIRAAFIFFTRLPLGGFPYRKADWKWAAAHAPLVGLVLGGALGLLERALLPLGTLPAALLVLGVSLLLTGAFHEDGLADTSDALGGGYNTERVLLILKDSRIGSFGGAALVVSIVGRAALLAQLGSAVVWALPLAWCGARVGPIWQMATLPYVTDDNAKSRELTRGGPAQALVASAWFAALSGILLFRHDLSVDRLGSLVAAVAVVTVLTGWRYWVRVRGITGDFLGATEQLCELAALAVLAWRL